MASTITATFGLLCLVYSLGFVREGWMAIEARSLHVVVWSSHPLANEQMAEAIARVLSRYAVDLSSGVEVTMPHDGVNVTYVARAAINLASVLRAARTPPAGLGLNVPVAAQ